MLTVQTKVRSSYEPPGQAPELLNGWKHVVEPVEPFLHSVADRLHEQIQAFHPSIAACADYALSSEGKQLRPVLVGLTGSAIGNLNDSHVTVAMIIEMVHLATLVHDDVMDEAKIRRGLPTLAARWGSEVSVLLGDCLFAHALKLAASFPTPDICRAVASATNTVCTGEILQTQRRNQFDLTQKEYFEIVAMKTGELFALACDLGAMLAGASELQRASLRQYGMNVGTAYQIYDDCVDLFGSESSVGKSLGTDLAKGKLTLPVLLTLERLSATERAQVRESISYWSQLRFPQILEVLRKHDALNQSRLVITNYLKEARQCLETLEDRTSTRSLRLIADFIERLAGALGKHR